MPRPLNILFVCLPLSTAENLSNILQEGGFEINAEYVAHPQQLPDVLCARFQVLLVDSLSRHTKLVEQIQTLLSERSLDIPMLVYSGAGDEQAIVAAMKAGAKDFISSNNPKRILPSIRRELASVQQRKVLRKQAKLDTLAQEIDTLILQNLDLVPLVGKICQRIAEVFEVRVAWIGGKQSDGSVSVVGASEQSGLLRQLEVRWDDSPKGGGTVGLSIKQKQAVTLLSDSPELLPWRDIANEYGIQSTLAMPMIVRGEIIGVLVLYAQRRDAFDAASVKRYTAFANRLAVNLLVAQEHQQFRLLSAALNKATQAMFITTRAGVIVWFNQALSVMSGYSPEEIMDSSPHLFNSGDYEKEFWEQMWRDILQGKLWLGDVFNRRKDGSMYSVYQSITPLYDSQGSISHFLCVQQDVSEKKELERKIEYLAYHDVLTGLPNRTLLNDRLQQAISQSKRDQTEFSLLFVDLDGFKEVNDTHGHAAGDQLLKMVAERLRACVREGDTVARLGGDEFMVLLRDVSANQGLISIAHKIIERIAMPYELDVCHAHITASIGISRYPNDAVLADKLMNCADMAMYTAKHGGKNRYAMCQSSTQSEAVSDWQI